MRHKHNPAGGPVSRVALGCRRARPPDSAAARTRVNSTQSAPVTSERRAWLAYAVASASIFMFVLDAGLVSIALPEIERDFPESSRAAISWVSTGNLVGVAGFMLVSGRVGDVFGRKRVFRWGLLVLAISALVTAAAPSVPLLIVARFAQGAASAVVTANSLSTVLADIPNHRQPLAIGLWGSVGSLAAIAGPTVGAELAEAAGWRVTLGAIAPIALATWVAGRSVLRESIDDHAVRRLAPVSVAGATIGVGGLALGLSQSGRWGWGDLRTWSALVVGAAAFATFLDRSRRDEAPLFDFRLLRAPLYARATVSAGLQQIGFFSWFFSTSFVLREIWGWSARETGLALSLTFVFSTVTGWVGGRAAERYGYVPPTVVSAVICATGPLFWIVAFEVTPSFWTVYLPGAFLFGAAGGVCGILTTGLALSDMTEADHGMAYSAHQTVRRMSSATGLALMATLLGEAEGDRLLSGARNVWLLVALVHLLMVVPLAGSLRRGRGVPSV